MRAVEEAAYVRENLKHQDGRSALVGLPVEEAADFREKLKLGDIGYRRVCSVVEEAADFREKLKLTDTPCCVSCVVMLKRLLTFVRN
jgi:hypothetical protein